MTANKGTSRVGSIVLAQPVDAVFALSADPLAKMAFVVGIAEGFCFVPSKPQAVLTPWCAILLLFVKKERMVSEKLDLIATAAFGLESQVAYELRQLGYGDQHVEGGRVTFRGDRSAIARTNLWLRVADRVQLRIGEFPARTFDELFDHVTALNWSDWLPEDANFPVDGKSVKSTLTSVPAVQGVVKKAIAQCMARAYGRAISPETGAEYRVQVALLNDVATLTLDTTGDGLHKRGYRTGNAAAPLKETLAAGLISLSRWRPEWPFADPLCGSGTLPIEAALQGLNRAPGIKRAFAAEQWRTLERRVWDQARQEARDTAIQESSLSIWASDLSPQMVEMARYHARAAGVEKFIRFGQMAVAAWRTEHPGGVLITNPPYGERLGDRETVEALYAELGQVCQRLDGWSWHIITAYPTFEKAFGPPAHKKRKLFNGRLRCDLYHYLAQRAKPEPGTTRAK